MMTMIDNFNTIPVLAEAHERVAIGCFSIFLRLLLVRTNTLTASTAQENSTTLLTKDVNEKLQGTFFRDNFVHDDTFVQFRCQWCFETQCSTDGLNLELSPQKDNTLCQGTSNSTGNDGRKQKLAKKLDFYLSS
jgi:hypothetical protein